MAKPIKVQIFDQPYSIGGDLDEKYVHQLAAYVDTKMREVAEATRMVDTQRIAVLAALAIADELETLRSAREEVEDKLRERAQRCLSLVERALKQTA